MAKFEFSTSDAGTFNYACQETDGKC